MSKYCKLLFLTFLFLPNSGWCAKNVILMPIKDTPANQIKVTEAAPAPKTAENRILECKTITRSYCSKLVWLFETLIKLRDLPDKPEDGDLLYRAQRLGNVCGMMVGFKNIPTQSRFRSGSDLNICKIKEGIIEYTNFGRFDSKMNGYVKYLSDAIYMALDFYGSKGRKVILRAHINRKGYLTGTFAAEIHNQKKLIWKNQCSFTDICPAKNSQPLSGTMKLGGTDPMGNLKEISHSFPLNITNSKSSRKR